MISKDDFVLPGAWHDLGAAMVADIDSPTPHSE